MNDMTFASWTRRYSRRMGVAAAAILILLLSATASVLAGDPETGKPRPVEDDGMVVLSPFNADPGMARAIPFGADEEMVRRHDAIVTPSTSPAVPNSRH